MSAKPCNFFAWAVVAMLGLHADQALSAVSCSASTSGVSVTGYASEQTTGWSTTGSVTVTCARTKSSDATLVYFALGVDGGLNLQGSQSRAKLSTGPSFLNYALWQNTALTSAWTNVSGTTGTRLRGQVNFGASTVYSASTSVPYYMNAQSAQVVPTGLYTDTQTLLVYSDVVSDAVAASAKREDSTTTLPVQITVLENCVFSSLPGDVTFAYTSFQPQAAVASTSFSVRCPSGTPYTLNLDANQGTLLGLTYSLVLSPAGTFTGTGLPQNASITGSIAPGQSGTCSALSCQASAARTLTIVY